MKKYTVISRYEDGVHMYELSTEELKRALMPGGELADHDIIRTVPRLEMEEFPARSVLIMQGGAFVPKAVRVVTDYEIP